METPILVIENGDISIFKSVNKAQRYLEPIDVKNSEYVAYDRDGHLLSLTISQKRNSSFFGKAKTIESVEISEAEEEGDHAEDLRKALINFFKRTGVYNHDDETLTMNELINKAVNQFGYAE